MKMEITVNELRANILWIKYTARVVEAADKRWQGDRTQKHADEYRHVKQMWDNCFSN